MIELYYFCHNHTLTPHKKIWYLVWTDSISFEKNPPTRPISSRYTHLTPQFMSPKCRIYVSMIWVSIASDNGIVAYSSWSHYLNQCLVIVNWTLRNKLKWNFIQNTKVFIHKNASGNYVCKMAFILPQLQWVNALASHILIAISWMSCWNAFLWLTARHPRLFNSVPAWKGSKRLLRRVLND